jgi:hypothetical protein
MTLKLSLVAAIRYLQQRHLAPDEMILIDLWGQRGMGTPYPGQRIPGLDAMGRGNSCKNSQLNCLMAEIGRSDLALQFITSFPVVIESEAGDENLTVRIMHRKTLQEALESSARHVPLPAKRKACLQSTAMENRPLP